MTSSHLVKRIIAAFVVLQSVSGAGIVQASPEHGQRFQDWTARCEVIEKASEPTCFVFQNLLLKKENKRLLHVSVGYLAGSEQPVAFFTLPLGVSLPGGLSIAIDDGKPVRVRYERCDESGCVAPMALTDPLVKSLRGGRWARVAFFDATRREVSLPVSLLGFTSGLNSLK